MSVGYYYKQMDSLNAEGARRLSARTDLSSSTLELCPDLLGSILTSSWTTGQPCRP
jgi:hypothetical protein